MGHMHRLFRHLGVALISLLMLVVSAFALLQTKWSKEKIRLFLIEKLEEEGISLSIENIEGTLPFQWKLKKINLQKNGEAPLYCETIKARLALGPLFSKEIIFSHFKMDKGSYKGVPFTLTAKVALSLNENRPFVLSLFELSNHALEVSGEAYFGRELQLQSAKAHFSCDSLASFKSLFPFDIAGNFKGSIDYTSDHLELNFSAEEFAVQNHLFSNSRVSAKGECTGTLWNGEALIALENRDLDFKGTTVFKWDTSSKKLNLTTLSLISDDAQLQGDLNFDWPAQALEGTLFVQVPHLSRFQSLFPASQLNGSLGAEFRFHDQTLQLQLQSRDLILFDKAIQSATLNGELFNLFERPIGMLSFEASGLEIADLSLSSLIFDTQITLTDCPFELSFQGKWKEAFQVETKGIWKQESDGLATTLNAFSGYMMKKPFRALKPLRIFTSDERFKLEHAFFDCDDGYVDAEFSLSPSSSSIDLKASHFPLALLAVVSDQFKLDGRGDLSLSLKGQGEDNQGSLSLFSEEITLIPEGKKEPLKMKVSLQSHLEQSIAQMHALLKGQNGQFLEFSASLPLRYQHFPLNLQIESEKPLSAHLMMNARIERVCDFMSFGPHRFSGWLSSDLLFARSLSAPLMQGAITFKDGIYENDSSGTSLKEISFEIEAKQDRLHLLNFSGKDHKDGKLSAKGSLLLHPKEHFPFVLAAELENLNGLCYDFVTSSFTGPLYLNGNLKRVDVRGGLIVTEAEFQLPDRVPQPMPELEITFVHPPAKRTETFTAPTNYFPLNLDLDLSASKQVFVTGKGLHSEWEGSIHLLGPGENLSIKGNLKLLKGEFLFFGKAFHLTDGEILFNDQPEQSAFISMSGTLTLPMTTIKVAIRGPLASPVLTFESLPYMPTSSMLSYILFNKDISEVSSLEAVQVAQALVALSDGAAQTVFHAIRKQFGIDKLNIVASENDPEQISIEIGKYLMEGLMITLSQGLESRKVIVEVDLKQGFRFEAELQEEERGKFSLKWHHNY